MTPPDVSIVLPTYNERENIAALLADIAAAFGDRRYEVLVVDDSSPDGTGDVVRALAAVGYPARLITRTVKEGIGAALRQGYDESRGQVIASMDADRSFDPRELRVLVERVVAGADVAVGDRHGTGSRYEAEHFTIRLKRLVSDSGNWILGRATGMPVRDFTGNFRAFRRDVWDAIQTSERTNTLLFEMLLLAYLAGFVLVDVPVTFRERQAGTSKLRLTKEAPKFLLKLASYLWRYRRELRARRRAVRPLVSAPAVQAPAARPRR